jgi:predicted Zn-dependent protease
MNFYEDHKKSPILEMKINWLSHMCMCLMVLLIFHGCATVPISGRKQLALISNEDVLPMSYQQYDVLIKESELSNNKEWSDMVKRAGANIQKAVEQYMQDNNYTDHLEGYEWEFNLIVSETVNAWCMPGGKVAFYTGIMPICADETGVAVVMGHEVAHAVANHGRERMSESLVANGLLGGLSAAIGQNPTLTQEILLQSAGVGTELGMLSFSRKHESEADKIGLIFMAMAGYDPSAAPKFWERMAANNDGELPPEFMSTHPHPENRIEALEAEVPNAMKYYRKN